MNTLRFSIPVSILLVVVLWSTALANDPFLHNDYALELMGKGEYEKALDQLQQAYSLFPYDLALRKNLAAAYVFVGKKEMEKNNYQKAADYFDHARELTDNVAFGIMRGIALYLDKNYDGARYEFERARAAGGDSGDVLYYLGRVQYDTGDLASALEYLGKAAALDSNNKGVAEFLEKVQREIAVESRMEKGHSSKFEISFDVEARSNLADAVLDALETAYNTVGADLDHFPAARVPVILYTKKDFRLVTAGPEWSGGLYDGKIRLPIGGTTELTPQLRAVLFHEYTHVVVQEITRGNLPIWLNEGLAEYEGRREWNPPMADLGKAAKQGSFLPFHSLEGSFASLDGRQAVLAYQQSYAMVNYMIRACGWFNLKELLSLLGRGMPFEAAVSKAYSGFGLDYAGLMQEWQNYMGKEYGGKN